MTPAELAKIGRALYGERWQTPLARMLSIADRSVRRWLAGESAVPAGVADEIEELLARDRAHQALNHLIELQSEMGRPTEIRLTQGRDAVGRRATKSSPRRCVRSGSPSRSSMSAKAGRRPSVR